MITGVVDLPTTDRAPVNFKQHYLRILHAAVMTSCFTKSCSVIICYIIDRKVNECAIDSHAYLLGLGPEKRSAKRA